MADNDNEKGAEQSVPRSRKEHIKEWALIIWLVLGSMSFGATIQHRVTRHNREFYKSAYFDAPRNSNARDCALLGLMQDLSKRAYQNCLDNPMPDQKPDMKTLIPRAYQAKPPVSIT
jgi:hypothetical protein